MRLDLAERLMCPRRHDATPLVVLTTEVTGRELRRGMAGCPLCRLDARIVEGDVLFTESSDSWPAVAVHDTPPGHDVWMPTLDRLIALLGLAEPGGSVLLTGRYARLATELARATDVAVVVMWANLLLSADESVASVRRLNTAVPFTAATFRGAALDPIDAGTDILDPLTSFAVDAVRSVAVGGRVVGTTSLARPDGLTELARDATEWVAERQPISAPIALRRGYSSPS